MVLQFAEAKLAQADARMTALAKEGKTHFADDFLVRWCFLKSPRSIPCFVVLGPRTSVGGEGSPSFNCGPRPAPSLPSTRCAALRMVRFQVRAVQLLIRCRRTLAFTFVYAFFIKDDRARKLFEFAQGELEKYTVRAVAGLCGGMGRRCWCKGCAPVAQPVVFFTFDSWRTNVVSCVSRPMTSTWCC